MREILFRGKRKDNGEWVYGWLGHLHCHNPREKTIESIYFTEITKDHNGTMNIIVDYKTVGQYTGLTDKNGKKIFEGDIVKHYNNSDDGFDIGAMYWDETFLQWKRTSIGNFHDSSFTYSMSRSCEYEVIGNIHDNLELLKGGEG